MDMIPVRCLVNSISRFIHLVSCKTISFTYIQKDYACMVAVLKLLKPVLDEVVDCKGLADDILVKDIEELDVCVNEAREFLESWSSRKSKINSVLQSEHLMEKIRSYSLEICRVLFILLQSCPSTSSFRVVQQCMQELKDFKKQESITEHIEEALRSQGDDNLPQTDCLVKVIQLLGLASKEELLNENIALEMERVTAQNTGSKGKLDTINRITDLISHLGDCKIQMDCFKETNGVPIPPYFRCPLSLDLMLDPVIVASGQTYDRNSIQKWLDNGLSICPKTHQLLTPTSLIPNHTVKAMIEKWLEENNIQISTNFLKYDNFASDSSNHVPSQDLIHTDSFRCSVHSNSSTSRSSLEIENGCEKLKEDASSRLNGECNRSESKGMEKYEHPSPEQSYTHSRSESTSSVISGIDYVPSVLNDTSQILKQHDTSSDVQVDISSDCSADFPSNKESGFSPWLSGKPFHSTKPKTDTEVSGREPSTTYSDSGVDNMTTTSLVKKLVEDLKNQSNDVHTAAAAELRLLTKHDTENRIIIGCSGAIALLLSLFYSEVKLTQEHAVTAVLNLSINDDNKVMIAEEGAIEPLIHVLKSGNDEAKANSAAAFFSLSVLDEFKAKIGQSGAVKALVDLLGSGTLRGKKDAATALFTLSIVHENKVRIVQAGAIKYLVELMDPASGMLDKAVALLANLSTVEEGRLGIAREGGIPLLVETVESGSQRGKENAASILLQLCVASTKFCTLVLQEGAVPPLVALSQTGPPRAKEKAQQLLSHFRNQRGASGKKNHER